MAPPRIAVLGASDKPERYAHQALARLREHGFAVAPINPRLTAIAGHPVFPDLAAAGPVTGVTVYVSPQIGRGLVDEIVASRPRAVILNPGSEDPALAAALAEAGLRVVEACTLVLLSTGQFAPLFASEHP